MKAPASKKTKTPCAACGTSPVNHAFFYAGAIIEDILDSTMGVLFGWIRIPREGRVANAVNAGFVGIFRLVGLASFDTNIEKAISGRSKLIWEEAARRGIPMQQIVMFGKHLEQYRAKVGRSSWQYFQSIPVPFWLPQKGYEWMDDKWQLASRLGRAGIPTPEVVHARSFSKLRRAWPALTKPVIIKPRSGSRGRHTTTNIRTEAELRSAYALARMIAPELVMEEHLFGSVYRATVVGGKLVGFFRADPPQITGDGIHTVRELIMMKNEKKNADAQLKEKLGDIAMNEDLASFIARLGYTLESIVPSGTTIDLSAKTGRLYGGYTREMLPEVHPKMRDIFAHAGRAIEASIVGFDLIIERPAEDPDTQKWGIIEANSLPFIDLHYFALEGTPVNIAVPIWDLWEERYTKG